MTRRDIGAVLFDKDGTLFDFGATWNGWAEKLLLQLGEGDRARAADLGRLIGYDLEASRFSPDSFVIAGTPDDLVDVLSPELPGLTRSDLLARINVEAAAAPLVEAVPLVPLLDLFHAQGMRLGVVTNDAEAPALAHLEAAQVRDRFDFIAGSDSGYGAKPAAGPLLAFSEAVGVPRERIIMVGDSTHDLVAGRAAGMWTVAVLTGLAGPEDLSPHADVVLPDIGHLPQWLGFGAG